MRAIILSGGPGRVNEPKDHHLDPRIIDLGVPILEIWYGMQVLMHLLGG